MFLKRVVKHIIAHERPKIVKKRVTMLKMLPFIEWILYIRDEHIRPVYKVCKSSINPQFLKMSWSSLTSIMIGCSLSTFWARMSFESWLSTIR